MTTFHRRLLAVPLLLALLSCGSLVAAKDTVKIAFIGPLTGGVAANGIGGRNSADLAVRLHNEDLKSKYKIELVVLDDECKPNVGVQVATKAASDKSIIAGVTHYCSAVAMPAVVWGAVLPEVTYGNEYKEIHRVNGTMINQNNVAARFMTGLGYKKWVVIHDTTDYGKGHNKYFSQFVAKAGGQIVGTFGVTADQQDFTAELTKVKELKPDVVYFGGLTPIGIRIRSQMDKLGIKAAFEGTSGIKSAAYHEGLGKDLAEGSLSFIEGAPWEKLPGGLNFIAKYNQAKYAEPAEAYGPFAFAAATLVMDAIEKVGPDRKKVRELLNATKDAETIIGKVSFDDHRQNIVPLISKYVVQDNKWVLWEDSEYATKKRKLPGL